MGRLGRLTLGTAAGCWRCSARPRRMAATRSSTPSTASRSSPTSSRPRAPSDPAPTIMIGHGWGGSGATSPPANYANAGFNVLTWDARGFGGSGGTVMIDHPDFEARDAQALIDFIAQQPEAQLDGRRRPAGRHGRPELRRRDPVHHRGAGRQGRRDHPDDRLELARRRASTRRTTSSSAGRPRWRRSASRPRCCRACSARPASRLGNQSPQFFSLVTNGVATGRFAAPDVQWLDDHGPDHLLPGPQRPDADRPGHRRHALHARRGPPQLHPAEVPGDPREDDVVLRRSRRLPHRHRHQRPDRRASPATAASSASASSPGSRSYLQGDASADTGPEFEWIDEDGAWHQSGAYPQTQTGVRRPRRAAGRCR